MAYSEAQRDALQAALASGRLRVTYDGQAVEYRSVAEIEHALAVVNRSLAASPPIRQLRIIPDKGL